MCFKYISPSIYISLPVVSWVGNENFKFREKKGATFLHTGGAATAEMNGVLLSGYRPRLRKRKTRYGGCGVVAGGTRRVELDRKIMILQSRRVTVSIGVIAHPLDRLSKINIPPLRRGCRPQTVRSRVRIYEIVQSHLFRH